MTTVTSNSGENCGTPILLECILMWLLMVHQSRRKQGNGVFKTDFKKKNPKLGKLTHNTLDETVDLRI